MLLGYHTGYWSAGPPEGVTDAIALCEKLGFDSIWTAEAYGSDCLTPLASGPCVRWRALVPKSLQFELTREGARDLR